MADPFLAEVRIVGFNFPPRGWAQCDGQILPINQNQSLYALLGTTYGGDGRTTFALPELRGRVPIHVGSAGGASHPLGSRGGEERHPLSIGEMPSHDHAVRGSSDAASIPVPSGGVLADSAPEEVYHAPSSPVSLRAGTVANIGGGQGHENMQSYLVLNFVIAIVGTFPSRNAPNQQARPLKGD